MAGFPMFLDLSQQTVLIVGGGSVALRKIQKLIPYGPALRVVAPEISPKISGIPGVRILRHKFRMGDLLPRPAMVIAATNDSRVNHRVSKLCQRLRIPVNVVDDPAACSFLFPALVQQGSFSAGISTGGASPTAAVYFKEQLQSLLPENLDGILDWLESQRPAVKSAVPEQTRRAAVFQGLFDACIQKGSPLTAEEMEYYVNPHRPQGSVALVGAGCGKADLITLRGLRLLRQCQAVVYDDLIAPALLDTAPESAQRIYMGKRSGAHSAAQSEINQTLIGLARSGLRVVRLKGGDPYLFGRGGEEMQALLEAGIPCQEVPGIPSAIGIPAEAGIPVTHRGASRGLHIVTAHTSDTPDGLPEDFDHLAGLSGTLVFLMGLSQLPLIAQRLMAAGKSGDTPAAVISGGNAPNPAVVRAPLSAIAQAAAAVVSPAVILVGEVAAMNLSAPLTGIRVGITGTAQVAEKQQSALEALGAETFWIARSTIAARTAPLDWHSLTGAPGWLVFTSSNGVRVFFSQADKEKLDLGLLKKQKFAVIGPATADTLAGFGFQADLCPRIATSEALARELAATARSEEEIHLLRSTMGSPLLPQILSEAGLRVRDIPLYDLQADSAGQEALPSLDYLTFSSAGGVELFFRQYDRIPNGAKCVCIGPVTANALCQHTNLPFLTAGEISAAGIVHSIVADCHGRI